VISTTIRLEQEAAKYERVGLAPREACRRAPVFRRAERSEDY
jgi:hypothetical protein